MKYLIPLLLLPTLLLAQNVNREEIPHLRKQDSRRVVRVPNIPGYYTLKGDFHLHTVFSDGNVWPSRRAEEAWEDGLDAIAITDHIEYLPHKQYICKKDFNTSYKTAKRVARKKNILLIPGAEITRQMPPGHLNVLFVENANKLKKRKAIKAIEAAHKQGAFIMWNHPGWGRQQPDTTRWFDFHTELYEAGMLHGVEVFNSKEWYPVTLDWCDSLNLTPFANTDAHNECSEKYDYTIHQRPMTLVFAKDSSVKAIKDAMFDRRTVAWFGNHLAGSAEHLEALFRAAVELKELPSKGEKRKFKLTNNSDLPFVIELKAGADNINIASDSTIIIKLNNNTDVSLSNCYTRSNQNLSIKL